MKDCTYCYSIIVVSAYSHLTANPVVLERCLGIERDGHGFEVASPTSVPPMPCKERRGEHVPVREMINNFIDDLLGK